MLLLFDEALPLPREVTLVCFDVTLELALLFGLLNRLLELSVPALLDLLDDDECLSFFFSLSPSPPRLLAFLASCPNLVFDLASGVDSGGNLEPLRLFVPPSAAATATAGDVLLPPTSSSNSDLEAAFASACGGDLELLLFLFSPPAPAAGTVGDFLPLLRLPLEGSGIVLGPS